MASSDSPSEASGFQDLDISIREQVQNAVARYVRKGSPPSSLNIMGELADNVSSAVHIRVLLALSRSIDNRSICFYYPSIIYGRSDRQKH